MLDRLEASLSFYKQALDLRDKRQDVLAANIANADTPGYKSRDFDFRAELDRVLGATGNNGTPAVPLKTTAVGHIGAASPGSLDGTQLAYRNAAQPSLDGNTVEMVVEQTEFSENAVRYQTSLAFINGRIAGLMSAIRGE